MRRPPPAGVLAVVAFALGTVGAEAQTVRGLLLESGTEGPVALGTVVLSTADGDSIDAALTDEQGFFSLRAEGAGRYVVAAAALGYQSVLSERLELEAESVVVVQLRMDVRPVPLSGVTVEASPLNEPRVPELTGTGFYERLERGRGDFLTPGQIRNHAGVYTPQLFREMHTVVLTPSRDGATGPWNDSIKLRKTWKGVGIEAACAPMIWIDDVYTELMPGEGLHDAVPKSDILGIEVHTPVTGAPLRYYRDNHPDSVCGAVLIWTDRR